ncbi:MAG: hypothetical protein AAF376_19450 [Pseudomonadota bacterium]
MTQTYFFDRSMLCDMPRVIPAHLEWLNARIVDQQTEITNPDFLQQ